VTLKIADLEICSRTELGTLRYFARFQDGLNVLAAPNSFGKSTLLQAIIYGLGLEGMFSSSRKAPFGPALLSVADFPNEQRARVRESWVTVTVKNEDDRHLRSKRFILGDTVDTSLVQTWQSSSYEALDSARQTDMFVRQPGAAARELGFHHELANFMKWDLPKVPGFNTAEVPLYLEAIFPLFYVEQKSGWSGVAPRMPTYLRIRDVLRRSVEFTLGLSTLQRLRAQAALKAEEEEIKTSWVNAYRRAHEAAAAVQGRISLLSENPVTPARRQPMVIEGLADGRWLPLETILRSWRGRLNELESHDVATAGSRTPEARAELESAENEVHKLGASLRLINERLGLTQNDVDILASRLAALDVERQRFADMRKLRTLGSELGISTVSRDTCPTCGQELDGREVATGVAASLDTSLAEVEAEKETLISVQNAASQKVDLLESERRATEALLDDARQRVRVLRDELSGPSNVPSRAQVREQVRLSNTIEQNQRILDFLNQLEEIFDELAEKWQDVRDRLRDLGDGSMSPDDQQTMKNWQRSFRQQVTDYGLRSIPPAELSIDTETLVPVNDGMELAFDLTMAISASDMIRTKWAYYVSLFEASKESKHGHHADLLIFDEPRQHETDRGSLAAFVRRLSVGAASGCQVIYATSEDRRELEEVLAGVPCHILPAQGQHLLMPTS
jgi:predicted nuclease with TOPRIM domain